MPDLKDIILGNVAIERGLVTRESLLELQKQQRDTGLPLGQVMLRAGLVNGPKLIELMKLVSLTIEHLDGGLEVGADSADAAGPPLLVGAANEPSKAPRSHDDIPVVPVVGGASPPRPFGPRSGATPQAPAASGGPRTGIPTPKPLPAPGGADGGASPKPPAPLPSPVESPQRPAPPPARPHTDRFEPARAQGTPSSGQQGPGYKPKTEAFDFENVEGYKPKTDATQPGQAGNRPKTEAPVGQTPRSNAPQARPATNRFGSPPPAAPPAKPNTRRFEAPRPAGQPPKPGTERFTAARAGGRTPSEAFRVELASQQKQSDPPEVQGSFGQNVDSGSPPKRKDKTRLFTPVSLPKETPAGKLPPEEVNAPASAGEHRISVPPGAREQLAGMSEGDSTLAGRLPSGIDAESRAIISPLDDSKVIKGDELPFEMPPGAGNEMPPPAVRKSSPPKGAPSRPPSVPAAPGAGRIPTAAPEGGRMQRPDDSGFLTASKLPDFEVRASDQPGGKPVLVKNPKAPEPPQPPKKETRKLPGNAPLRSGLKSSATGPGSGLATAGKAAKESEKKEGAEGEEPRKRSKKLLVVLLVLLGLILAGGGALFYLKKITLLDFQQLPKTLKEAPELFKHGEYWKDIFKF